MIEVKDVTKMIKGQEVLSHINYMFSEGKTYLITGHNGCGKTMLLRALCGLITPTEGGIKSSRQLRFGVIIETPTFLENETALYNLKYLANIQKRIGLKEIEQTMQMLNLLDVKKIKVKRFSLGMKQRLGICQAIMEDPDVLLLDEPFNAIDNENVLKIYDILNELRKSGKTIIIASHEQVDMDQLVIDERILMSGGKIVQSD